MYKRCSREDGDNIRYFNKGAPLKLDFVEKPNEV